MKEAVFTNLNFLENIDLDKLDSENPFFDFLKLRQGNFTGQDYNLSLFDF